MATLRSDFLIHWTGKDIQRDYAALNDTQRDEYIRRLHGTLSEGLWMNKVNEKVFGYKNRWIKYKIPMTCFTEIRLSDVKNHTGRYGCLGFGFNRSFVIERCGLPVQYVSGSQYDPIIGNIDTLFELLKKLEEFNRLYSFKCEDGLMKLFDENTFERIRVAIETNVCFMKEMSECKSPVEKMDFKFLNEAEWRILLTDRMLEERKLLRTGVERPYAKIPFKPSDLKVLILPDNKTRQQVMYDQNFLEWFGEPPDFPIIATVEECSHF